MSARTFSVLWLLLALAPAAGAVEIEQCKGALVPSVPGDCQGVSFAGCCDPFGRVLWCDKENLFCLDCSAGFDFCGWDDSGYYDCGESKGKEDPSGQHPYSCGGKCGPLCHPGSACSPDCPGQCGTCQGSGGICLEDGSCLQPACEGKECGVDPAGLSCGSCPPSKVCLDNAWKCVPLPAGCLPKDGPGCAGCPCESCVCAAYPSCCTENWDIFCVSACQMECEGDCSGCPVSPSCAGLECGNFCGLECGQCPAGKTCQGNLCCTPECTGLECGSDGCGGSCGQCGAKKTCVAGHCEDCQPKCDGKQCGPDGCGGECGECAPPAQCIASQCVESSCLGSCWGQSPFGCYCDVFCLEYGDCCPDVCQVCPDMCENDCFGIMSAGCCKGTVLKYCSEGQLAIVDCAIQGDVCGWNDKKKRYECGQSSGADPSGEHPFNCAKVCQPDCDGKECGPDGCDGSCGGCADGLSCTAEGSCCAPDCNGKECGLDGCGGSCGLCPEGEFCDFAHCTAEVPGGCAQSAQPGCAGCACEECVALLDPYCLDTIWDKKCVDWCVACGTTCPCVPFCPEGAECGDDGCGGSCGSCPPGLLCQGYGCHDDPCDGIPFEGCCDGDVAMHCTPQGLEEADCNDDPNCGWNSDLMSYFCGTKGGVDPSGLFPKSCEAYCIPDCWERTCGDDGCGGSCGECGGGQACSTHGQCVDNECGDVNWQGCCDGHTLKWCENGAVEDRDCRGKGPCGWDAEAGYYNCATEGGEDPAGLFPKWCPGACIPSCAGKDCGDDGCGEECGQCEAGLACNEAGHCASPPAEPDDAPGADVGPGGKDTGGSGGCAAAPDPGPASTGTILIVAAILALLAAGRFGRRGRFRTAAAMPRHGLSGGHAAGDPVVSNSIALSRAWLVIVCLFLTACSNSTRPADAQVDSAAETMDTRTREVGPELAPPPDALREQVAPSDLRAEARDVALAEAPGDGAAGETGGDLPADLPAEADGGGPPPIDCENIPQGPFQLVQLPGSEVASEDLAFDGKGYLVGSDNYDLYKTLPSGKKTVFSVGLDFRAGLAYLPNGWLVICDDTLGRLVKIDPDGVQYDLVPGGLAYPNGITVDLKGFVYVSEHDAGQVIRVHPFTGDYTVIAEGLVNPNGVIFNPTYDELYIGSFCGGWVYKLSIAEDGTPGRLDFWKDMTPYTTGCLDGSAVDACGNVYFADYNGGGLWRIPPDGGEPTKIVGYIAPDIYLPNFKWGQGPGWDPLSLYAPHGWQHHVYRIQIGVPSAPVAFP